MIGQSMQRMSEIPIGRLGLKEVIELLDMYNKRGYQTNIKSRNGRIVVQIHRVSS